MSVELTHNQIVDARVQAWYASEDYREVMAREAARREALRQAVGQITGPTAIAETAQVA